MNRYSFANVFVIAALLASVLAPIGAARAQDTKAIVIAIPITVLEGQPTAPALAIMKDVMAHIAGQPGLIDQALLASEFPNNKPSHIWISRWRSLSDSEALMESPDFLDLLPKTAGHFDFNTAEVFKPVP